MRFGFRVFFEGRYLSYVFFVQVAACAAAVAAAVEEEVSLPPQARRLALLPAPLSLSLAPDSEKTSVAARELLLGFSCLVGPCGKSSSLGIVLEGN